MNSWQQPVTGEPSLGTEHWHWAEVLNTNPADANVHAIDISTSVPTGTKLVKGIVSAASTAVGDYVAIYDGALGTNICGIARCNVASQTFDGYFDCPVTGGNIYYGASNARISAAIVRIHVYSI